MISVLDIFRIGIGPSSSHTVGPMRIAARMLAGVPEPVAAAAARVEVRLLGSLAWTGEGHGTPRAVLYGLAGHRPETVDMDAANRDADAMEADAGGQVVLPGGHAVPFHAARDVVLDYDRAPTLHPNEMRLNVFDADGAPIYEEVWFSTGGGFFASEAQLSRPPEDDIVQTGARVPHPFSSGAELGELARALGTGIAEVVFRNEAALLNAADVSERLDGIAAAMLGCIDAGLSTTGVLPGRLKVVRRAPELWDACRRPANEREALFDRLNVYAMSVNEENAAGGKVVTAPTNGAAGVLPAVLRHYLVDENASPEDIRRFLLTAGGIAILYKQRASISGAEMGCQGEVGVACSMAAGALAAQWGGSPQQVLNAAEIGMEHNLGLTCDPVAGLVQVPCIERNAIGAVKAANAARLALHRDGPTAVTLDQVIETMRQTGLDMSTKYKETSQGGLAVNVVEC